MGSSGRKRDSLGHRLAVLLPKVPWPSELPSSFDAASQLQDEDSKVHISELNITVFFSSCLFSDAMQQNTEAIVEANLDEDNY